MRPLIYLYKIRIPWFFLFEVSTATIINPTELMILIIIFILEFSTDFATTSCFVQLTVTETIA